MVLVGVLLAACTGGGEAERFATPEVVNLEARVKGHTAQLRCALSAGRLDRCGFIVRESDGEEEILLEGKLSGDAFTATVSGLYLDRTYTWEAWMAAGESVIHSPEQTLEAPEGAVPVPDPAFRAFLMDIYDSDGDGFLTSAECRRIREIEFCTNDNGVKSLKGIEYMPNLEKINCYGLWCDTKDVSGYPYSYVSKHYRNRWETLFGPVGTLEEIDVSGNPKLTCLDISNNAAVGDKQVEIDLSNNPKLEVLDLSMTYLFYPDISNNPDITELWFSHGRAHDINGFFKQISGLHHLKALDVEFEQNFARAALDLSNCPDLETLHASYTVNYFSDLSLNPKLQVLNLICSEFPEIDLSVFPELRYFHGYGGKFVRLDVSHNPKLVDLDMAPLGDVEFKVLYVAPGQVIPGVTVDRNPELIPECTRIEIALVE